jgi:hypothetical protein
VHTLTPFGPAVATPGGSPFDLGALAPESHDRVGGMAGAGLMTGIGSPVVELLDQFYSGGEIPFPCQWDTLPFIFDGLTRGFDPFGVFFVGHGHFSWGRPQPLGHAPFEFFDQLISHDGPP